MTHLLPLSAIVETLPVLFGRDGDFEAAPPFRCPIWIDGLGWKPFAAFDECGVWTGAGTFGGQCWAPDAASLDLRVPSVAARVAGLCARALEADPRRKGSNRDVSEWHGEWSRVAALHGRTIRGWTDDDAETLAALFLALAPRIAALGDSHA